MNSKKIKTILIYKYLYKYSDAQNPISSSRLIELLGEDGVECERKSIYSDIKALNECGVKVVSTRTPRRGFYLDSREFRVPEVRLLIDAVNSAPFITPQMTRALADKLKGLLSQKQAKSLSFQVYRDDVNKCDNESIYNIIDTLDKAINSRRLVRLKYRTRKIDKENKKSFTTKLFTLSPYALIWKNDKYYLVCNKSSHDNLMNLRLDRIRDIMILDSPARPVGECSEYKNFDAADYSAKMFNMFTGSVETVTLKCDLDLREQILDRFFLHHTDRITCLGIFQVVSRIKKSCNLCHFVSYPKLDPACICPHSLHMPHKLPDDSKQLITDDCKEKEETSCTNILPEKSKNSSKQKSPCIKHQVHTHKLTKRTDAEPCQNHSAVYKQMKADHLYNSRERDRHRKASQKGSHKRPR